MRKTGLRVGKVSSVDYETGMMQVVYKDKADAVTAKLPYANFNREYSMPEPGDSVLVGHLSNGSSRGVVICPMWNGKNTPPESGRGLYRKELSREKGAAYVRFDGETGEYLVRAPAVLLHGVDRTDLEGPEVCIAANIRTEFESPEHRAVLGSVSVEGLDGADVAVEVTCSIQVCMESGGLEALLEKMELETIGNFGMEAGKSMRVNAAESLEMGAGKNMEMSAGHDAGIKAERDVRLEDGKFRTTLSAVLERLETLDGDRSARK